jgi:RNA polymerase subunit RPABC4/transcription elongation factor Spt4
MVTCFECNGIIDPHDRYCRWCGGTVFADSSEPNKPYVIVTPKHAAAKDELCSKCPSAVQTEEQESKQIGRTLLQSIFHDDERELNSARDLM